MPHDSTTPTDRDMPISPPSRKSGEHAVAATDLPTIPRPSVWPALPRVPDHPPQTPNGSAKSPFLSRHNDTPSQKLTNVEIDNHSIEEIDQTTTPAHRRSHNQVSKAKTIDYRIEPYAALPSAQASRTMQSYVRAVIARRKRQHLALLLDERERLELERARIECRLQNMPEDLIKLQRELDELECDVWESSDDETGHGK